MISSGRSPVVVGARPQGRHNKTTQWQKTEDEKTGGWERLGHRVLEPTQT